MFVRFRQGTHRLQISLIETRRIDGKVRHEHIATLGSIEISPSVEARLAFWQRLHERLAKLANRVDAAMQGKILGDVHARIPMVTLDEQRAKQLENAEADEKFWTRLRDVNEATAEDQRALSAKAEQTASGLQAQAADAAANAATAKERAERIKRGEDVPGGIGKQQTYEDYERIFGKDVVRHMVKLAQVCEALGNETVLKVVMAEKERAERAAIRTLHRCIESTVADDEDEDEALQVSNSAPPGE
jgi:hypothetical protein